MRKSKEDAITLMEVDRNVESLRLAVWVWASTRVNRAAFDLLSCETQIRVNRKISLGQLQRGGCVGEGGRGILPSWEEPPVTIFEFD